MKSSALLRARAEQAKAKATPEQRSPGMDGLGMLLVSFAVPSIAGFGEEGP